MGYKCRGELNPQRKCAVCIFLACKEEEYPIKTCELVSIINVLVSKAKLPCKMISTKHYYHNTLSREILVSSKYYKAKAQLLADERTILKILACEVITIQPHKLILNFACTLSA